MGCAEGKWEEQVSRQATAVTWRVLTCLLLDMVEWRREGRGEEQGGEERRGKRSRSGRRVGRGGDGGKGVLVVRMSAGDGSSMRKVLPRVFESGHQSPPPPSPEGGHQEPSIIVPRGGVCYLH